VKAPVTGEHRAAVEIHRRRRHASADGGQAAQVDDQKRSVGSGDGDVAFGGNERAEVDDSTLTADADVDVDGV
jgi:hypothetical protein